MPFLTFDRISNSTPDQTEAQENLALKKPAAKDTDGDRVDDGKP